MAPFPTTKGELIRAGYAYTGLKTCPCGEAIELWKTPNGSTMPMNTMADVDSKAESHFATCRLAGQFRRKR